MVIWAVRFAGATDDGVLGGGGKEGGTGREMEGERERERGERGVRKKKGRQGGRS